MPTKEEKMKELLDSVTSFNTALRHRSKATSGGLSPTEFFVIFQLAMHGNMRPSDLAQNIGLARSSMTSVIDGLVQKELVSRMPSLDDRRAFQLGLTPEGERLFQKERSHFFAGLQLLEETMSDDEFHQFIHVLHHATAILRDTTEKE